MTRDDIMNEIMEGLLQVDSSFVLVNFDVQFGDGRSTKVNFTARNADGEEVTGTTNYE